MQLSLYQVDAFTDRTFGGNPAAVVPLLDHTLSDDTLQYIAEENNLSETAFLSSTRSPSVFGLRWFTPAAEVDLCGHATLAAAFVVFSHLRPDIEQVHFNTRSGSLIVTRTSSGMMMDFPATEPQSIAPNAVVSHGLGCDPVELLRGFDHIAILENAAQVRALSPDFNELKKLDSRGVVATAVEGDGFVSRCFFPKLNVNEDPVTGSAHCQLAPLWSKRLNKKRVIGEQLSSRGGRVICEVEQDRVKLFGQAVEYLRGTITI